MRPQGEIRSVIFDSIRNQGPAPLCDLVVRTQVGYVAARRTVDNCMRSGSLVIVGHEKREHSKKWVALYDVVDAGDQTAIQNDASSGLVVLSAAVAGWR